jgi:hypothetical protein
VPKQIGEPPARLREQLVEGASTESECASCRGDRVGFEVVQVDGQSLVLGQAIERTVEAGQ